MSIVTYVVNKSLPTKLYEIIFDAVYGSSTLSSPLYILVIIHYVLHIDTLYIIFKV